LRPLSGCLIAETPGEVQASLDDFYRQYVAESEAWVDRGTLLAELQYRRRVEQFAELIQEVARR
jgi:hypothetical protein